MSQGNAEDSNRVGSGAIRAALTDALGLLEDEDDSQIEQRPQLGISSFSGQHLHQQSQGFPNFPVAFGASMNPFGAGSMPTLNDLHAYQSMAMASPFLFGNSSGGYAAPFSNQTFGSSFVSSPNSTGSNKCKPRMKTLSKPKRPLSAYNIFFQHERQRLRDNTDTDNEPGPGFAGLARHVAAKWKALDEDERKVYEDKAMVEKKRYQTAMGEWKKEEKARKKEAAKRARQRERAELSNESKQESKTTDSVARLPLSNALIAQVMPPMAVPHMTNAAAFRAAVAASSTTPFQAVSAVASVMSDETNESDLATTRSGSVGAGEIYSPSHIMPPDFHSTAHHQSMSLPSEIPSAQEEPEFPSESIFDDDDEPGVSRRMSMPIDSIRDAGLEMEFFDIMERLRDQQG